ncbi:MAG TPA: ABC transporter permease [Chitinophagaceae bacterium]
MFKNYCITAFRHFRRNKLFSLINILGLSIGISAALVIFLIVWREFSFDRFEKDGDRIFRVVMDAHINGGEGHSAGLPAPLGGAVQNELTGLEQTVPVFQFQGDATATVSVQEGAAAVAYKSQKEIVFTNPAYFELLSYRWLAGSPVASLRDPFKVVLTESRAKLYFPGVPVEKMEGKVLTYNDGVDELQATVSGIVKDLNENTDFRGAEFISMATIAKTSLQGRFMMTVWDDWMAYSHLYVKLAPGGSRESAERQLAALFKKYNTDTNKQHRLEFRLQPLSDIHFNSNYPEVGHEFGNRPALYGLLAVAAFLLLLGCINFINLATAQASRRAKEIGIRKTMGSSKKQLIGQVLSETFFIALLATLLSIVLTPLLLNMFRDFIPAGLQFDLLHQPSIAVFLLLITLGVSFLSGLYPAFILAGFNPVLVLKNQVFTGTGQVRSVRIRKVLTVSQFVIAQFFIIATLMVSKQIHYTLNKDLGFRKEAILTFDLPFDTVRSRGPQLLNDIKAIPEVEMASSGFFSPASGGVAYTNVSYSARPDLHLNVDLRWGDTNYLKLYQVKILAGRNVAQSDTFRELLVNETYAKLLGFQHPETILNKQLTLNGKQLPVVGVMKDFHEESLHSPIGPVVFAGSKGPIFHILLRPQDAEGQLWQRGIARIQKAYRQIYPDADFNYAFLDDTLAKMYKTEENMSHLLIWATGLTIFISCLGLLGLVIYTTNTRAREIGVRKVLGASVTGIVSLLSRDFVRLVLIAFFIAVPVAWWAVYKWLDNFAYRTSMSWWIFGISGLLLLLFAVLTLSVQTIRTALANPVESLRVE